MATEIGTRSIPSLSSKDPKQQQFFEEVKHRLDNLPTPTPGPTGAPGAAAQAQALGGTGLAAGAINAYKVVTTDLLGQIIYADATTSGHGDQVLGVSLNSATSGLAVTYQSAGDLVNPGWTWTPGEPVFLGLAGALTHSPNVGIFQIQIGYAKTATRLAVALGLPIYH